MLAQVMAVLSPGATKHFDVAGIGSRQAFANFDGRRLAGAVGPEEAKAFTRRYLKIQTVDRDDIAEGLAEPADPDVRVALQVQAALPVPVAALRPAAASARVAAVAVAPRVPSVRAAQAVASSASRSVPSARNSSR